MKLFLITTLGKVAVAMQTQTFHLILSPSSLCFSLVNLAIMSLLGCEFPLFLLPFKFSIISVFMFSLVKSFLHTFFVL